MPGERELWILDHAPIMGGGQVFALKLARAAGRARIACPAGSELARRAATAGVPVTAAEFADFAPRHAPAMVRGVLATRRLLASVPADAVVVANDPRTQAYAWAATRLLRRHAPVVLLVHEQESAARPTARFVYPRFGEVVAVGANTAATYARRIPGADIRRVNNFLLDPPAAAPRRPAPAGPPQLGVLARMIPEKGIRELVDELAAVPEAWSTLRVGAALDDGAYVAAVEDRVRAHGLGDRVELLGQVDDVPGFLAETDVLLVPSVGNEAQPTVILEALASGRPVVVRAHLWSADFEGLPVVAYRGAEDLEAALADAADRLVPLWPEIEARFGPAQALDAIYAVSARS